MVEERNIKLTVQKQKSSLGGAEEREEIQQSAGKGKEQEWGSGSWTWAKGHKVTYSKRMWLEWCHVWKCLKPTVKSLSHVLGAKTVF